jgi:hypothetical protein
MISDLGCCIPSCAQTPTLSREVKPQQPGAQQLDRSEAGVPGCTGLGRVPQSWLAPMPAQPLSPNRLEELGSSWGEGDAQALLGCHNREETHPSRLCRRRGWQGAKRHHTGFSNVDALLRRKGKHIQAHDQALHQVRLQGRQKDTRIVCMVKANMLLIGHQDTSSEHCLSQSFRHEEVEMGRQRAALTDTSLPDLGLRYMATSDIVCTSVAEQELDPPQRGSSVPSSLHDAK